MIDKTKVLFNNPPSEPEPSDEQRKQVTRALIKEKEEARQQLNTLVTKTSRILFSCKAVFPMQLFPDEMSIEENRVNIIKHRFLATSEVKTATIKEITQVIAELTPFFASLKISSQTFVDTTITLRYLRPKDAAKARRIIEGLKMLSSQGVDTSLLETEELIEKVEQIGKIGS